MLTEVKVKQAKPKSRSYKLADGGGLYLEVATNGSRYWRYKYRALVDGRRKEKRLALGVYPEVSLKQARDLHASAHAMVSRGGDPSALRQQEKQEARTSVQSFLTIGQDWFETQSPNWSTTHTQRQQRLLKQDLAPLHQCPIDAIKAPDVLRVLRIIESRGAIESAHRAKQVASQVFRHAIAMGLLEVDPAATVAAALRKPVRSHHAAITDPEPLGELLRGIDGYRGTPVVRTALKLTPMLFVRPGELRHMEWSEVDLDKAEWLIPGPKTKRGRDHYVPLASQVIELLKGLRYLTGNSRYVFPNPRSAERPMSENAVLYALRGMGVTSEQATPHGFRATAKTMMEEQLEMRTDWIEHQLAHAVRDATGEAYNGTKFLSQRKKMMQDWADYLDQLKGPEIKGPESRPSNLLAFPGSK